LFVTRSRYRVGTRAMIKLGARDRAQLVVFAYQSGMVSPRDPVPVSAGSARALPADSFWGCAGSTPHDDHDNRPEPRLVGSAGAR
jgi:hypothetical protein